MEKVIEENKRLKAENALLRETIENYKGYKIGCEELTKALYAYSTVRR